MDVQDIAPFGADKQHLGDLLGAMGQRPDVAPVESKPLTPGQIAADFLRGLDVEGWHNVVAIVPDGPVAGRTFPPGAWADIARFVNERDGRANIYYSPNEPQPGAPHDKLEKTQIVRLRVVHVDVDPADGATDGATLDAERTRLAELAASRNREAVPPSFAIDSGNGVQLVWRLPEKLDASAIDTVEALNRGAIAELGGDAGTWNADRLLRLPGTMNLPTRAKAAKGRTARRASILSTSDRRFGIDALASHFPPQNRAASSGADDAEISGLMAELDHADFGAYTSFSELPEDLRTRFEGACERSAPLRTLWAGGKAEGDRSGSGYRASLAAVLGKVDGFDVNDFAALVWVWEHAVQVGDDRGSKLTVRDIARTWARCSLPAARERQEIVDRHFKTPKPADPFSHISAISGRTDAATIPLRQWVIEPRYPRGVAIELVGEPGISKSTFVLHDALLIATGETTLLNGGHATPERLHASGPVLIYNSEDSLDEMRRRLVAAKAFHGLADVEHHPIYLWSGLDKQLVIAQRMRAGGPVTRAPDVANLEAFIRQRGIVAAFFDPRISLGSGLVENSTEDQNDLLQELHTLAARCNCAVVSIHHTSKQTRDMPGDMGAGRGAFSAVGKVRSALTVVRVSADDAEAWGFGEAAGLIRIDYSKTSHGKKHSGPLVLRVHSAPVGNGLGMSTAAEAFEGSPAELHRLMGDQAPVLEVLGIGRNSETQTSMSTAEKAKDRHRAVAEAVAEVMGDRLEIRLTDALPEITNALNRAGVTVSADRGSITDIVRGSLAGGGVQIVRNGQSVRVQAQKKGSGLTAPWSIVVADNLSGKALQELPDGSLFS